MRHASCEFHVPSRRGQTPSRPAVAGTKDFAAVYFIGGDGAPNFIFKLTAKTSTSCSACPKSRMSLYRKFRRTVYRTVFKKYVAVRQI